MILSIDLMPVIESVMVPTIELPKSTESDRMSPNRIRLAVNSTEKTIVNKPKSYLI